MKKVGICTLYFANNFGAILQAFALQEVLINLGYDVEFLRIKDFLPREIDTNIEKFEYSKSCLKMAKNLYNKETDYYDTIIVGSDEMWNLKNTSFEHLDEYFGYDLNCKNIISYAPSANRTSFDFFKNYYKDKINFDKFDSLSVRDRHTQDLVKKVSNRDAELVLDPTLLIEDFKKYAKYPNNNLKDYIVIYGYKFSHSEIEKITKFAKDNNKKVYSLGFPKDWCDTLNVDIFEFLGYINNADYVITNTFHGLLFSMILEKEFVIFSNGNTKVEDIMERFGINDRDGMNICDLSEITSNKVDYSKVNEIKLQNRKSSLEYLKNNIG